MDEKVQRDTEQRRVMLEELRSVTSHPTAANLYEMVRKRLPKVSLGTVYRNLDTLVQTGQIQKIDSGSAEARFDGNPGHHHHVRCLDCGRVEDVLEVPADTTLDEIKEVNGFEITGHHLELIGLCPECRRSAEAQPGGDDTSARI